MRRALTLIFTTLFLLAASPVAAAPKRTTTLRLDGLSMQMSAKKLRRLKSKVYRVRGVLRARVDLATGELFIAHRQGLESAPLERAAERAGFSVVKPTVIASTSGVQPRS